jgi:hypothetical protein
MSQSSRFNSALHRQAFIRRRLAALAVMALTWVSGAQAQMWVRDSTTMPESVTGGGQTGSEGGTLTFTNSVYAGLEYNDNITLKDHGDGGLILRAGLASSVRYPVSQNNELRLDAALEHVHYLTGVEGSADYNSLLPGTETTFTIFAGPVRVRNFVRVELSEDPVSTPVISDTARFGRFNGYAGSQIDWDMNRVVWQLTPTIGRQFATEPVNSQIDYWSYGLGLRAVFPLSSATSVGVGASRSINHYDERIQNDSVTNSIGVFGQTALSRSVSVEASVGLQSTDYDQRGSITDQDDYEGFYASASLSHQLRKNLSYSIQASHDIDEGYGTNFYEVSQLVLTAKISSVYRWEIVVPVTWQWVSVSGPTGDDFTRLGVGVEARRPLGRKLDLSLGASSFDKFTDQAGAGYAQRRLYFSLRYTF